MYFVNKWALSVAIIFVLCLTTVLDALLHEACTMASYSLYDDLITWPNIRKIVSTFVKLFRREGSWFKLSILRSLCKFMKN